MGWIVKEDLIKFDLNNINPINGFKKIFSLDTLANGVKFLFKIIVISLITYLLIKDEIRHMIQLLFSDTRYAFFYILEVVSIIILAVSIFMICVSFFDYFYQRWSMEQKMMMTKDEVKREQKEQEINQAIGSRIKKMRKDFLQRKMMQEVPKSTVVITNPTHLAIALNYDSISSPIPKLVAKGSGEVAARIKKIAEENSVPIIENKSLARVIYKTMELGQLIPRSLFDAVAEVISYVLKLKGKLA